jgi:hypothetical protein
MAEATTQFESDELLKLLTDALRAGPGSPQWHDAVLRLRSANPGEADEYRLLLDARENLESGREYRSIRPGPNFTRKVLQAVEEESEGKKAAIPSANLIAIAAAAVILAIVIIVAIALIKGGPVSNPGTLDDLRTMTFKTVSIGGDFAGELPTDWVPFGQKPTISDKALHASAAKENPEDFRGGGIHAATPIPPEQPFAVEATLRLTHRTPNIDFQLFISDSTDFNNPKATSPREFVVNIHDGQLSVFTPDNRLAHGPVDLRKGDQTLQLLLKMDKRFTVLELDGQILYAGEHGLSSSAARYPGVRFLTKGAHDTNAATLRGLRLLRP